MTMTAISLQQRPALAGGIGAKTLLKAAILAAVLFVLVGSVFAAESGTEFKGLYDLLMGWAEGYLGRGLAIAAFIAGIGAGVARSSPMLAAIGIVFALVISVGPGIINGILTATI